MSIISVSYLPFLFLLLSARRVSAEYCYSYWYSNGYDCSSLSPGARAGIGIGVAAAVLALILLCGYWRRRQLAKHWRNFRPPPNTGDNIDYSNYPPPPNNNSIFNGTNPYGANPPPPPESYQPSMAGYYGGGMKNNVTGAGINAADHEHGYEWAQARENERVERERTQLENRKQPAPPGYDVVTSTSNSNTYAPPSGPPPTG